MSVVSLAVPSIDVDVPGMVAASAAMVTRANAMREQASALVSTWSRLPGVFAVAGSERIYAVLNPLNAVADDYVAAVGRADVAIDSFAVSVNQLITRRTDIAAGLAELAVDEAAVADVQPDTVQNLELTEFGVGLRERELRAQIAGLARDFAAVQQDLADSLRSIDFGAGADLQPRVSESGGGVPGVGTDAVWVSQSARFEQSIDAGVGAMSALTLLSTLSPRKTREWLDAHPEFVEAMAEVPPSADVVAEWWSGLSSPGGGVSAAQSALIAGIPIVIGNLGGVDLASRVSANKSNITTGIRSLNQEIRKVERTPSRSGAIDAGRIAELEKQIDYYTRLRDEEVTFFDAGSGEQVSSVGHHLVAFDHDRDVIAEYSGALDAQTGNIPTGVQYLGIYVPGTGTTIANFDQQVTRSEYFVKRGRPEGSVGMITWKGGTFPQGADAASGALTNERGEDLAAFGAGIEGMHAATVTGVGYSAGGSVLGSGEAAGLRLDRSLHVSSAGAGWQVDSLEDYPNTSSAPHFSMMAPGDPLGLSQGLQGGDLGHGGSPLTMDGFTRLETGWTVAGDQSSGQILGHDLWDKKGTAVNQMRKVITGGDVELYAKREWQLWSRSWSNPVMDDGYEPRMIDSDGDSG